MASLMEAYCTEVESFGMLKLTDVLSYGYDKLWSNLYLPRSDFSLIARGDDLKSGNGGFENGPSILPKDFSAWSFSATIDWCRLAE